MPAELVAHRRDRLHRGAVVLARGEPGEEGRGDDVHRHRVVDRRLDRPAPLARVVRETGQLGQVLVVLQGGDEQVEQPGADHGPAAPGGEDLRDVVDLVDGLEQLPALGVGLHHGVLDAVVDHLGEVAGARLPAGVHEAVLTLGTQCVERRLHLRDVLVGAADHQRVAVLEAPDAAGGAAVDEADPTLGQHDRVDLVVGVLRVAAVDDEVALAEEVGHLSDGLAGRLAGRDHHPDDLGPAVRAGQLLDHLGQAPHVGQVRVEVEADDGDAGVAHPGAHVAAHLPEPDETDVHGRDLRVRRAAGAASGDT